MTSNRLVPSRAALWLIVAYLALWQLSAGAAAAAAAQQWVETGGEALADGEYPWYDSQTDSLKPIEFREEDTTGPIPIWLSGLLGSTIKIVAWTLLAVAIATLIVLLIVFARNWASGESVARAQADQVLAADQVEALPFLAERPRGDLLGQARRHYEAGNYSEAIIYLFSYELLELDKFSFIRLARGKTNRQYLREVGRQSDLRSPLELTLVTFESVFFGRRSLDRAGFEACWHELPQFEQHLRAAT